VTTEEIRKIAIDSSKSYYEYLDENNKGIQEIDIFDLEYLHGKYPVIKLRLSAKLFDIEAVFFKNLRNNKQYDITDIKIIEYDNDKNILLIKPSENVFSDFEGLHKNDLKVISDLKFLVDRVKVWYEKNGSQLSLPTKISKYSKDFQNIEFFPDKNLQPSENQKKSLENIFTSPFSYVWGAPGTGKTQFVLAYAVLHYMRKGDTIAILAPTNNAIEQVLKGILKITDKAAIDRKQIIRLGSPSKKFAEEFPEVCEEKGVQKNLAEVDKQIDILERMLDFQNQQQIIDKLNGLTSEFDNLNKLSNKIRIKKNILIETNKEFKKKEIYIKLLTENLHRQNKQLEKMVAKKNSISHKIIKIFNSKPTYTEREITEIRQNLIGTKKDLEYTKYELSEINKKKINQENNISKTKKIIFEKITSLKDQKSGLSEVTVILSNLSMENINEIKKKVNLLISKKKEKLEIDGHLFSEYKHIEWSRIKSELENHQSARAKLAVSSTDERLKSVNIIACTLDGYIGRYTESKLNVDHIFLDEAGYANVIKALTLFNHSVPISFLGDHKQLPPVCEINDSSIEKENKFFNMFLWAQSAIFIDTLFSNTQDLCRIQYLKNSEFNPISICKTSLNSTYRFGNNLATILSKYVYVNDFNSNNPDGETQILYINAKKTDSLRSRISINEVSEIEKLVHNLKKDGIKDFVILTPYKNQIKLLNNSLPQERNNLKILTVHGSQGKEWDTVILSVVDTSDKWFVDSTIPVSKGLNLVNTAVSRAKKNLIIICDTSYWKGQKGQLVSELINCGKEIKM